MGPNQGNAAQLKANYYEGIVKKLRVALQALVNEVLPIGRLIYLVKIYPIRVILFSIRYSMYIESGKYMMYKSLLSFQISLSHTPTLTSESFFSS